MTKQYTVTLNSETRFILILCFVQIKWKRIYSFLFTNLETIQRAALFCHGTQVAMFSRKCRVGISISKAGMGRDPPKKYIKQKIPMTANLSKSAARNSRRRRITRTKKQSPAHPVTPPTP